MPLWLALLCQLPPALVGLNVPSAAPEPSPSASRHDQPREMLLPVTPPCTANDPGSPSCAATPLTRLPLTMMVNFPLSVPLNVPQYERDRGD